MAQAQNSFSTDSIAVSLHDAERLFLEHNFKLLASKYQINEADAAIVQARLWDNPSLNIEQGAYNKETSKWFDVTSSGQTAISVQQLIDLGGKRSDRVHIETINAEIAHDHFYDLIRTLRYTLRRSFFELYFIRQSIAVYDRELAALGNLLDAYTQQYQQGNLSFKELARLQALKFGLASEQLELRSNATEKQNTLLLLMGDVSGRNIAPVPDAGAFEKFDPASLSYRQVLDSGIANRSDLRIAAKQIESEEANLSLQHAMRIPNVTVGLNYDRNGSYIPNYNSVSLSFDVPLWNLNQGNIAIAENKIEETKALKRDAELSVTTDVAKAYAQLVETDKLYRTSRAQFDAKYETLLDGITTGYQNHTISLLEFIDYYETYKTSKTAFNHLQLNRLIAMEDLNLATGTILIP